MGPQQAKRLGAAIRRARVAAGLSQNKLAELANERTRRADSKSTLRNSTILRLERGEILAPRPDLLAAIASVLDVDAADYFTFAGYTTPNELPDVDAYLRAKFPTLRQADIKEVVALISLRCEQRLPGRQSAPTARPRQRQRARALLTGGGVA
jgi:transcriptional regulator with XRE-family HTH domain